MAKPDSLWKGRGDDYCSGSDGHVRLWGGRGSGDCSGGGGGGGGGPVSFTQMLSVGNFPENSSKYGYKCNYVGSMSSEYVGGVGLIEEISWESNPLNAYTSIVVNVGPSDLSETIKSAELDFFIQGVVIELFIRRGDTFFADFPNEQVADLPKVGGFPVTISFLE